MPSSPRRLASQVGAHESWARTPDRAARTAPARKAFEDRFAAQVREQFPDIDDAEVATRAEHAKKAYYLRLALASAKARKAKAARRIPRSCRDSGGPLCTPDARCPAHRIDVDPPTVGDMLAGGTE